MSFADARPKRKSPTRSARISPMRAATAYDGALPRWRDFDDGIEENYPPRSRLSRFATKRTRALLAAGAMSIGAVVGALGQHVVASHKLDVAMVELAETMIDRLRSLKGEGFPRP